MTKKPRLLRPVNLAVLSLLTSHTLLLAWIGYVKCPAMDEVGHLAAGMSHWEFGNFDLYRVNPPLVRAVAAIPVVLSNPRTDWNNATGGLNRRREFSVGRSFVEANGRQSFWYFTMARWACIPLSLVGALTCFFWSRELYGETSGLVAMSLWCFSPNILGNAAMITPDAGAAALGCLATYAFWKWLRQPGWQLALLAGVALGAALLTKSTWIILFALWPMVWFAWMWGHRRMAGTVRWKPNLAQLVVILVLATYLINLGYLFEGSLTKVKDFEFISVTLAGPDATPKSPGNRLATTVLAELPVPLPENYVRGMDVQKREFETMKWSYLRGKQQRGGWWYYYLYAMAVKVPLGTWLLGLLALAATVRWRRDFLRASDEFVLLAPAILILLAVSSQTGFNRYLRYVLPAFPFLFIWISKVGRAVATRHRTTTRLATVSLLCTIIGSLSVFPHSLSYFNSLAGGPTGGHFHIVDANIDWGQDLLYLQDWLDRHPEAGGMRIAYFGFLDTSSVGLDAPPPPPGPAAPSSLSRPAIELGPQPGWYAVSVNHLRGYRHYDNDEPKYTYFLEFEPVAMAGYSIYLYEITVDEANRVRRRLKLPPL